MFLNCVSFVQVLLFLNPASGRGKAIDVYEHTLANVLRSAGIVADVRITEKDGGNSVKGQLLIGILLTRNKVSTNAFDG